MFRLVTLLDGATEADTVVLADADGYSTEPAAWAAYCASPEGFLGVGRHDSEGRLIELIVDQVLDNDDSPARWDRLARCLGVRVRTMPMALRPHQVVDINAVQRLITDIEADFSLRVSDPLWRRALCRSLHTEPLAMAGVVTAVHRLAHARVLDLYPDLRQLAAELPESIRIELRRHIGDPATGTGVAALRLGL